LFVPGKLVQRLCCFIFKWDTDRPEGTWLGVKCFHWGFREGAEDMYWPSMYSDCKFAVVLNWDGTIGSQFKLFGCKVCEVVCPYVKGTPQWGKQLLSIFGVKVPLDPVDGDCELFAGDFFENSNPEITIC